MNKTKILPQDVAQDVLEWLKNDRIAPFCGRIFSLNITDEKSINTQLGTTCGVCAKGAMLLTMLVADRRRKIPKELVSAGPVSNEVNDYLSSVFSKIQIDLIEAAFECDVYHWHHFFEGDVEAEAAVDFGMQFETPKDRLKAIMENIIENNGVFTP